MEIGSYYDNIQCKLVIDDGRKRVISYGNSAVPDGLLVECSRSIRNDHPVGTLFTTENCKVIQKPDSRIHLRAKDQMIYPI